MARVSGATIKARVAMLLLWACLLVNCLSYLAAYNYPPYDLALAPVEILLALSLVLQVKGDSLLPNKMILYKLIGFTTFFFMIMCLGTVGRPPYWVKHKHDWESKLADMLFILPLNFMFVLPLTLALGFYILMNSRGKSKKNEFDFQS